MDQDQASHKRQIIAALSVLIIVVIIVVIASAQAKKKSDEVATTQPATSTAVTATKESTTSGAVRTDSDNTYKDGTYTAKGSYASPGGTDSVTVHLTIKDDVVADSSVDSGSTSTDSEEYVNAFIASYKQYVDGKDVDSIGLSRVSGSSLTPQGFNKALSQIKTEAQS